MEPQKDRLAYVIGNDQYDEHKPLFGCLNDAENIGISLNKCGFVVKKFHNLDFKTFSAAVDSFKRECAFYNVGLFYFAGHGFEHDGNNYLCPTDTDMLFENISQNNINITNLIAEISRNRDFVSIVILDCCRVAFKQKSRSANDAEKINDISPNFKNAGGAFVAYATTSGAVANENNGKGIYTQAICKHIETVGLTIESLFKNVRRNVIAQAGSKQIPWEYSSLMDDFYFIRPKHTLTINEIVERAITEAWSYEMLKANVSSYLPKNNTTDNYEEVMFDILTSIDSGGNNNE